MSKSPARMNERSTRRSRRVGSALAYVGAPVLVWAVARRNSTRTKARPTSGTGRPEGSRRSRRAGDHAGSERLGEVAVVAVTEPPVVNQPCGVGLTGRPEAELGPGVVDRVPADGEVHGLGGDLRCALEHRGEHAHRQLVEVPADDVEGEQGLPAHRVDVGDRVGGRDPAPGPRVVDDRGDEVDRAHDRPAGRAGPHGGVVAGLDPHQEVGVRSRCHVAQDLRQLAGGELRRSAGAVAEAREAPDELAIHLSSSRSSVRVAGCDENPPGAETSQPPAAA